MTVDKAGRDYWSQVWTASVTVPKPFNPRTRGRRRGFKNRQFHSFFQNFFALLEPGRRNVLEIGCASSSLLPYFAREYGAKVNGLDYSEVGCEQARQVLSHAGVPGEITCADLFSPPPSMLGQFDAVLSFGVIEHFEDTAAALRSVAGFLRPGGLVFTGVPNMTGLVGLAQKLLNRPIYDIHVPLDKGALRQAHEAAGFEIVSCDYFLFTDFGVPDLGGIDPASREGILKEKTQRFLRYISNFIWLVESNTSAWTPNRVTSPFIHCTGRILR